MKLATFTHAGATGLGVAVADDQIVDLAAAAPELPREMTALLAAGAPALAKVRETAGRAAGRLPLTEVRLEAPVRRPPVPSSFLAPDDLVDMMRQRHA